MKLLTKELVKTIPAINCTESEIDPLVRCKFFTPWSYWSWYVIEYDGTDEFYGYVSGDFPELGYFSLSELESLDGPLGLKIERDLYFTPQKLSNIKNLHE